jgi:DNA-binding transcriptional regulator GbsR (MarR family)
MHEEEVSKKIFATFAGVASSLGFNEVHGTIIGSVLVANKPVSLQDIAKRTGYSLSSVSISVDLLELIGIVRKIKNLGDRKIYVKLEGDLLDSLKKAFMLKIQKEIFITKMELEKFKPVVKDQNTKKTIEVMQVEVDRLQKYINKLAEVELPK